MPGFNFFRIYPKQKSNLIQLINSKGIGYIETKQITYNQEQFLLELYFSNDPPDKPIKWIREIRKMFSIQDLQRKYYSAVILISFKKSLYAICFGLAHFFVSRYADYEFGINIASRIIESYKIKNSREFGGVRTKSIETYSSPDEIPFEAGEAVNYIKGKPINPKRWGKNISCGQSVQLRKRDLTVDRIHEYCYLLEEVLSLSKIKEIPTSIQIRDPNKKTELRNKLIDDMKNGNYMISISQQQLSGVAFLFSDQYDYYINIGGRNQVIDETIDLQDLNKIVVDELNGNYEKLLNAEVEAQEDGNTRFTKPFIHFVDYVDTENNYYIEEGRWYQFDKNYLHNVRNEVDKIQIDKNQEIKTFDEKEYIEWLDKQEEKNKYYREKYLNYLLEERYNYINHDRSFQLFEGLNIEITDLLKNDNGVNTIYIVKIGKPQKLSYAIDQATASIRYLERNQYNIPVNSRNETIQKVCLWLFFERTNAITYISEVKSLIFLMKLANWRKSVLLSGLQPELRISYR